MAKANISNAETQSLFLLFNEHGMHRKNENPFVHLVSSVFMFILTTDFRDLTDFHHERKRDNPFNLCYLCSRKRIRNRIIRFI